MHVIPCALDRVPAGAKQGLMAGFYGSILPAVWSFQLALRSRGLGSAWTTLHLEYEDEAADLLGIPPHRQPGGAAAGGLLHRRRLQAGHPPPGREVTYFNAWKRLELSLPGAEATVSRPRLGLAG